MFGLRAWEPWREQAACRDVDPRHFHPESGPGMQLSVAIAKRTCKSCPVQAACLDNALAMDERFGIFGGVNFEQLKTRAVRDELRRLRQVELVADALPDDSELACGEKVGTEAGVKRHSRAGEKVCQRCAQGQYWARLRRHERRQTQSVGE